MLTQLCEVKTGLDVDEALLGAVSLQSGLAANRFGDAFAVLLDATFEGEVLQGVFPERKLKFFLPSPQPEALLIPKPPSKPIDARNPPGFVVTVFVTSFSSDRE